MRELEGQGGLDRIPALHRMLRRYVETCTATSRCTPGRGKGIRGPTAVVTTGPVTPFGCRRRLIIP